MDYDYRYESPYRPAWIGIDMIFQRAGLEYPRHYTIIHEPKSFTVLSAVPLPTELVKELQLLIR